MTTRGTILKYGEMTIVNCLTREFRQEAVFDESGTDLMYHKFTITVVGFVHGDVNVFAHLDGDGNQKAIGPSVVKSGSIPFPGQGAALNETNIRGYLLHPRRRFLMAMNVPLDTLNVDAESETLLECAENGDSLFGETSAASVDVNNGPTPRSLSVTQVTANKIFKIEYTIEICKLECNTEGSNSNFHGVLSNRWSVEEDVDENFFTTRTVSGHVRVARSTVNPLDFRGIVVPSLSTGFKRQSMKFIAASDGLSMNYSIVDREFAFSPPFPATSWSLRHTESVTNSMIAHADIAVRLSGPGTVNKKILITRAAQIIWAKIFGFGQQPGANAKSQYMIESLSITDVISDNENAVEAHCRVQHLGGTADKNNDPILILIMGTRFPRLGQPLDGEQIPEIANLNLPAYEREKSIDPFKEMDTEFGARFLVDSFSCHLQSSCDEEIGPHSFSEGNPPNPPWEVYDPNSDAAQVEIYESPFGTEEPEEDRSESFEEAIYTHYQADDRYMTKMMRVQMPIAKSNIAASTEEEGGDDISNQGPPNQGPPNQGPPNQGKTSITIALAKPTLSRVIRIRATRVGRWPQLPLPKDLNPVQYSLSDPAPNNQQILSHKFYPQAPERNGSGQWIFTVDAEYEYAADRNLESSEKYSLSLIPWLKMEAQQAAPAPYIGTMYYDQDSDNPFGQGL